MGAGDEAVDLLLHLLLLHLLHLCQPAPHFPDELSDSKEEKEEGPGRAEEKCEDWKKRHVAVRAAKEKCRCITLKGLENKDPLILSGDASTNTNV